MEAGRTGEDARARPAPPSPERRYNEEEVALILRRAAAPSDADAPDGPGAGPTLAELKEIGAETGIAERRIERAAASLAGFRDHPLTGTVLGMPTTVQLERVSPGRLDEGVLPELLDMIRSEFARQGIVEEVLGGFEWRARSSMGGRYVSIRSEEAPDGSGGQTRIRVLGNYRDGMLVATVGVGPIATMGTGALAVALGAASPFLFVPAAVLGGAVAAFGPWRRAFRREKHTLHRVLARIAGRLEGSGDE